MKINKVNRLNVNKVNNRTAEKPSISFGALMSQKKDDKTLEKLNNLLKDVRKEGKLLADKRTIDNLLRYKKKVKEFMNEAVDYGLKLDRRGGFRPGRRSRVLSIVSKVDEKLLEVTDAIVDEEKKGLNILKLVGEIEGLMVNIYA